jgi:hypothetical protein
VQNYDNRLALDQSMTMYFEGLIEYSTMSSAVEWYLKMTSQG